MAVPITAMSYWRTLNLWEMAKKAAAANITNPLISHSMVIACAANR